MVPLQARSRRTPRALPVLALLCACRSDDSGHSDRGADPIAVSVVSPKGEGGGARTLVFTTAEPCRVTVTLEGAEGTRTWDWPALATEHAIPVVGLRAEQPYTVRLDVETADGVAVPVVPIDVTGDPLPLSGFPELTVLALDPDRIGPGWTLLSTQDFGATGVWILLLDESLVPVWWAHSTLAIGDLELTAQGTLVGLGDYTVVELDWLGTTLRSFGSNPLAPTETMLDVTMLHHEITPLPDGTFVTLSARQLDVDTYPTSYLDPTGAMAPARILDETIVRFDGTGATVEQLFLSDVFDTARIGYGSLGFGDIPGGLDWVHSNAVERLDDGGWLVSMRHQDAIARLEPSGEVRWILGDPAGWTSPWAERVLAQVGPAFRWPYHAHAPELRADGTIVLFDNGNEGHTPYTPDPGEPELSRVLGLQVDEAAGTVAFLWEYAPTIDGSLYAQALGDADRLDDGTVLAVFGRLGEEGGVTNADAGRGALSARIVQFDPEAPEPPIADLRIGADAADSANGWAVYRAARLTDLFPQAAP